MVINNIATCIISKIALSNPANCFFNIKADVRCIWSLTRVSCSWRIFRACNWWSGWGSVCYVGAIFVLCLTWNFIKANLSLKTALEFPRHFLHFKELHILRNKSSTFCIQLLLIGRNNILSESSTDLPGVLLWLVEMHAEFSLDCVQPAFKITQESYTK